MSIVYLLLGSNLGDRHNHLNKATSLIGMKAGSVKQKSRIYESPPWGFEHPQNFLNQALEIETTYAPKMLLHILQEIESDMGRKRNPGGTYEARTIDIDIIFYDDIIVDETDLCIPHPRLHERKFALLPLKEIKPQLYHPILKKTIEQLLLDCNDESPVDMIPARVEKEEEVGHAS